MLGLMRKHATSWLIKVALFAIVIVFIFWGGYSYTERRASRIAVVNGSYIGIREYQSAYNNLLEQTRRQYGNQISSQLLEVLNLKEQALEGLISRRLLLAEAERLNLKISDEELQKAIVSYPAFQVRGQFSPQLYQRTLNYMRLTPQEFEASQSESLLIAKVQGFITRGAKVLDAEVLSYFHRMQDKVNLAYVVINPKEFADRAEITDEALEDYFKENRERYRLDVKRNMVYVQFALQDYLNEIEPTGEEIQEYYKLHEADYSQPQKVRARHILFRVAPQTSPSALQSIQKRADEVLALARKGDAFAELAQKYSEDPSASKGGDLGYFTRDSMVKPFSDVAFSLKKGEISDLVRTRYGFHIIKVEDIQESFIQPFSEVQEAVIQSLKEERALEIAQQEAESFVDEVRAVDDLQKAAAARNLPVKESGFFSMSEEIPNLGRYPEINEAIFSLQVKEVSPVLSAGKNPLVAQLLEIQDSRLPELKEVVERVRKDWLAEESKSLARKQAEDWLTEARGDGDLAEVAGRNGLKVEETGLFTFTSPAQSLGRNRELLISAFALTPERPVAPQVFEVGGSFRIFQLLAREPALAEQFQEEKVKVSNRLLQLKREQTFQLWLRARREQSDVRLLQEL